MVHGMVYHGIVYHFGMMDHFGPSYFPVHCRIGLLLESVALQIIIQACSFSEAFCDS